MIFGIPSTLSLMLAQVSVEVILRYLSDSWYQIKLFL